MTIEDASSGSSYTWTNLTVGSTSGWTGYGDPQLASDTVQYFSVGFDTTTNSSVVGHEIGIRFRIGYGNELNVANVNFAAYGPPRLSNPGRPAANQYRFTMNGWPGAVYNVVTSSNLKTWATNTVVTNVSGADAFTDTSASASRNFYGLQRH